MTMIDIFCQDATPADAAMLSQSIHQPRFAAMRDSEAGQTLALAYPALTKISGGEGIPPEMLFLQVPFAEYRKAVAALESEPPVPFFGPFLLIDRSSLEPAQASAEPVGRSPKNYCAPPRTGAAGKRKPWWRIW